MRLEFIRKTRESRTVECPAIYRAEDGRYVIQGKLLDPDTRARLRDLADDETAVIVPADVIAGIVEAC
jgi:TolB-like protein